jgi:hypothetical protein
MTGVRDVVASLVPFIVTISTIGRIRFPFAGLADTWIALPDLARDIWLYPRVAGP